MFRNFRLWCPGNKMSPSVIKISVWIPPLKLTWPTVQVFKMKWTVYTIGINKSLCKNCFFLQVFEVYIFCNILMGLTFLCNWFLQYFVLIGILNKAAQRRKLKDTCFSYTAVPISTINLNCNQSWSTHLCRFLHL